VVLQLLPILTPDGRANLAAALVDAEGQVNNASTNVELAGIALERAKRVLKEGAGSQRLVDEAQAAFDLANKTKEAVAARQLVLKKAVGDIDAGTAAPIAVTAPEDGLLRALSALPGQTVPAGAALFEVVDLSTVWLRVPVPVGDREGLLPDASIEVVPLAAKSNAKPIPAKPVAAPPSANPLANTVDLWFELPNKAEAFVPGQRLGAGIPLNESAEAPTVPWAAIVYDIHGGTWVYVETAPRTYVRKRVSVNHTHHGEAVLAGGPAPGTKVVVAGVQELFGAETGFVK
jgi:membrane fusion protein, heavy metal efflux system